MVNEYIKNYDEFIEVYRNITLQKILDKLGKEDRQFFIATFNHIEKSKIITGFFEEQKLFLVSLYEFLSNKENEELFETNETSEFVHVYRDKINLALNNFITVYLYQLQPEKILNSVGRIAAYKLLLKNKLIIARKLNNSKYYDFSFLNQKSHFFVDDKNRMMVTNNNTKLDKTITEILNEVTGDKQKKF